MAFIHLWHPLRSISVETVLSYRSLEFFLNSFSQANGNFYNCIYLSWSLSFVFSIVLKRICIFVKSVKSNLNNKINTSNRNILLNHDMTERKPLK